MITKNDIVASTSVHSHAPDARQAPMKNILAEMRDEAKTSPLETREIVTKACAKANSRAVKMSLPKISSMSRTIRRIKNKRNAPPMTPRTVQELVLSELYTVTSKGENFLLYDSGATGDNGQRRTIIFATQENVEFLQQCREWFMDGTFSICPPLFQQIYTIHGIFLFLLLYITE